MKTMKSDANQILGIDLGTTNLVAATIDTAGIVTIIPNMDGDLMTLSAVSVSGETPVVGKAARQDRFFSPEMYVEQFKRYMSKMGDDGKAIPLVTGPDGTEYTPQSLSSEVLGFLKKSVEQIEGRECESAVISVPAYFPESGRRATKAAGLVAGFKNVHIIDEPVAAATYYGLAKGHPMKIAVFDFGGGTFDICILNVHEGGEIRLLAVDGDPECGGGNVDEAIFQRVREFLKENGHEMDPEKDLAEWLEALDASKEAKEVLARKEQSLIPLRVGSQRLSMDLTRAQLKEYSADIVETLTECCQRALKKAGLQASDIDKVLLVGGSTRLPFVPEIVREVFGKDPATDTDPDLAVAKGAAILAAAHFASPDTELLVEGKRYLASAVKHTQIATRDLCIAAANITKNRDETLYNIPIIRTGATLPYEDLEYFTPLDSATKAITVKLYDGHAGELSDNCVPIHEAKVKVQPADKANNDDRIEIKISMDTEGLVHLDVRDMLLDKPVPIEFKFHTGISDEEIDAERKQFRARHELAQEQGV